MCCNLLIRGEGGVVPLFVVCVYVCVLPLAVEIYCSWSE